VIRLFVEVFGAVSTKLSSGEGELTFPPDTSPAALVDWLGVRDGEQFVILINGQPVQLAQRDQPVMKDGDRIAVFPPMEGG